MTLARLFRSILGVIIGYMLFVVSVLALFKVSGRAPHAAQPLWFITVATLLGVFFAATGGLVAARVAGYRPQLHGGIVGFVLALRAVGSLFTSPSADATWSQWSALLLMAPAAWLGGRLVRD